MKAFYVIRAEYSPKNLWVSESKIPASFIDKVVSGLALGKSPKAPTVLFDNKSMRPVDLVGGLVRVPIISPQMRAIVETFGEPVEFHPVRVVCKKDPAIRYDYEVLNVLDNLDAFDWERSEYRRLGDSPVVPSVTKLVLKEGEIGTRALFRLRAFPGRLICSERARAAFEAAKLRGLSFQLTSEYS